MSGDVGGSGEAEWTGCVHCGQGLPHKGTGWRESSRCRLFQRIAEQAWATGYGTGLAAVEALTWFPATRDAVSGHVSPPRRKTHIRVRDLDRLIQPASTPTTTPATEPAGLSDEMEA